MLNNLGWWWNVGIWTATFCCLCLQHKLPSHHHHHCGHCGVVGGWEQVGWWWVFCVCILWHATPLGDCIPYHACPTTAFCCSAFCSEHSLLLPPPSLRSHAMYTTCLQFLFPTMRLSATCYYLACTFSTTFYVAGVILAHLLFGFTGIGEFHPICLLLFRFIVISTVPFTLGDITRLLLLYYHRHIPTNIWDTSYLPPLPPSGFCIVFLLNRTNDNRQPFRGLFLGYLPCSGYHFFIAFLHSWCVRSPPIVLLLAWV